MLAGLAADAIALAHAAFIAFVVAGGPFVARRPRLAWLHLPAAAWGALVELMAWPCPLTPLENALRRAAGAEGYGGSFVERWLLPWIYPPGLDAPTQLWLGLLVVAVNAPCYALLLRERRRPRQRE